MLCKNMMALRQFSAVASKGKVGFIGMGNMGLHMATNLKNNGFAVKGYDLSDATLEKAQGLVSTFFQLTICDRASSHAPPSRKFPRRLTMLSAPCPRQRLSRLSFTTMESSATPARELLLSTPALFHRSEQRSSQLMPRSME